MSSLEQNYLSLFAMRYPVATPSTSTPAPISRISDMFSDISDSEEETESNEAVNGALKVRGGN